MHYFLLWCHLAPKVDVLRACDGAVGRGAGLLCPYVIATLVASPLGFCGGDGCEAVQLKLLLFHCICSNERRSTLLKHHWKKICHPCPTLAATHGQLPHNFRPALQTWFRLWLASKPKRRADMSAWPQQLLSPAMPAACSVGISTTTCKNYYCSVCCRPPGSRDDGVNKFQVRALAQHNAWQQNLVAVVV